MTVRRVGTAFAGAGMLCLLVASMHFYGVQSRIKVCNALPGPAEAIVYFNEAPSWPVFLERLWGYASTGKDAHYVSAETGLIDAGHCKTLVSDHYGFVRNAHAYFFGGSSAAQLKHIYDVAEPVLNFGEGYQGSFDMTAIAQSGRLPETVQSFSPADPEKALPEFTRITFDNGAEYVQVMSVPETLILRGGIAAEDVETELRNARQLKAALERWDRYRYKTSEKDWPFTLGVRTSDENSRLRLGIQVTSYGGTKPVYRTPLKKGDWIVHVAGHPVFHEKDMYAALAAHGRAHGIDETFPVIIRRGDQVLAFETVYFFSEEHYGRSKKDREMASKLGFAEAAAVGAEVTAICAAKKATQYACGGGKLAVRVISWLADKKAPDMGACPAFDFQQCYFDNTQYVARLMQMYPEEFKNAGFVGMFVPTTRLIALGKLGVMNKVLDGAKLAKIRGLPKAVVAEMADAAIWETLRATPMMDASHVARNIKSELPFAAGIGFVTGMLSKSRR
jgi:hypothetical protein